MSAGFYTTIYLHGPHKPCTSLTTDRDGRPSHAAVSTSGASILVGTRAEAEALIKAFIAARDLLPPDPDPLPPDVSGDLGAIPPGRIGDPAPLDGAPACTCTDPDCPDPVHQEPAGRTP